MAELLSQTSLRLHVDRLPASKHVGHKSLHVVVSNLAVSWLLSGRLVLGRDGIRWLLLVGSSLSIVDRLLWSACNGVHERDICLYGFLSFLREEVRWCRLLDVSRSPESEEGAASEQEGQRAYNDH